MLKRTGQGQAAGHWVWQVREVVSFIVIIPSSPMMDRDTIIYGQGGKSCDSSLAQNSYSSRVCVAIVSMKGPVVSQRSR